VIRAELVRLINAIDLGAPVAEHDTVLYEARIETTAFQDLFRDRVDLIPGTKGSGKTALFRLVSEFLQPFLLKTRTVILTGVEATGDPVFHAFKKRFEELNEMEFQNFWRVYFVALLLEKFIKQEDYKDLLVHVENEVKYFVEQCRKAKIPEVNHSRSFKDIVEAVLCRIKLKFGNAEASEEGMSYSAVEIEPAEAVSGHKENQGEDTPMFLNEIHDAILAVLKKSGVKVWTMLDRLDEVFPRRTKLERKALRALLATTRNFPTASIRIKLFLRDDIFESVLVGHEGFTALTHIEARRCPTLRWSPKDIQLLIVKRFSTNSRVRTFFKIDRRLIEQNDMEHAVEVFNRMFPIQVVPGKRQSGTLDWLYHHCEDGRGVVTPRDVIDLLEFALKGQVDNLNRGVEKSELLVGALALKEAFVELSKKKCRTYLEAEFPEFWPDIKKFENSKAEHNEQSLTKLLGEKWKDKVEDLMALGFLKQHPKRNTFVVPFIFRVGMSLRQGKAF